MKCMFCDVELVFIKGMGWVHQEEDMQVYKVAQSVKEDGTLADDHVAAPDRAATLREIDLILIEAIKKERGYK